MKKGIKTIFCVLVRLKEAESFVLFQKNQKQSFIRRVGPDKGGYWEIVSSQ